MEEVHSTSEEDESKLRQHYATTIHAPQTTHPSNILNSLSLDL